eukprot:2248548-Prymnesium_polylepis.1
MLSTLAASTSPRSRARMARPRRASSPQTVAGHRDVSRDTAAKEPAAAGMLSSQLGSMRSDLLWVS